MHYRMVYLAFCPDIGYKIGHTRRCPRQRTAELARAVKHPVYYLGSVVGGRARERGYHYRLRAWLTRGREWFTPPATEAALLRREFRSRARRVSARVRHPR